jgi:molecular chaperone DnaK (HSP70)
MKVGIDLGTTYSAMAYVEDEQYRHVPDTQFKTLQYTPSIVKVRDNQSLVGRLAAIDRDHGDVFKDFKLALGTGDVQQSAKGEPWPSEVLSGLVLRKLRLDFRNHRPGDDIESVVLTHPANFHEPQRRAILQAAQLAHFSNVTLLEEPVAAALHYMKRGSRFTVGSRILVFDWGGGTFDAAVVTLDPLAGQMQVHAKRGLARCGGRDVNEVIRRMIHEEYERVKGVPLTLMREGMLRLDALIEERVKLELTAPTAAFVVPVDFTIQGYSARLDLSRRKFEAAISPLIERTVDTCLDCLADAQLTPTDIEAVILVGGTSQLPEVKKRLSAIFGPKVTLHEPLSAIAHGAAVRAMAGAAVITQDVCSHNLGLLAEDRRTHSLEALTLIQRNTLIGHTATRTLTAPPGRALNVHLVEFGDDRHEWRQVGVFSVNTSTMTSHDRNVIVSMKYDGNGFVEVTVLDAQTLRPLGDVTRASLGDTRLAGLNDGDIPMWQDRLKNFPVNGVTLGLR